MQDRERTGVKMIYCFDLRSEFYQRFRPLEANPFTFQLCIIGR